MKVILVLKTSDKRYYELSEYINTGRSGFTGDFSIAETLKDDIKRIRPEYKEELTLFLSDERGTKWVCISDAHTHTERLAFPAFPCRDGYSFTTRSISGKNTFMIYGGDSRTVHPDEVYLRHLAMINKLKWEGVSCNQ